MPAAHPTPPRRFRRQDLTEIRRILKQIGWAEQYILAFEKAAMQYSRRVNSAVYVTRQGSKCTGFVFVELHEWNQLAQIQGLAVDPACQRQGLAASLVAQAELFAHERGARGIFVDTPSSNAPGRSFYEAIGYQAAYIMPQYYEANLDGITYQKFFQPESAGTERLEKDDA